MQAPTFADVDADGELEVLLGTTSGAIYVLRGNSGETAPNFPIYSQVTTVLASSVIKERRGRLL